MLSKGMTWLALLAASGAITAIISLGAGARSAESWSDIAAGAVKVSGVDPGGVCSADLGGYAVFNTMLKIAQRRRAALPFILVYAGPRDHYGVDYVRHQCPAGGLLAAFHYSSGKASDPGMMGR
jgi:hypothetical protein